ncbi:MAG: flagellar biosynthesis protein FlgL [Erythrobacter sp.]|uniref:flagellin N-terminal helical domain-containing protein n=1 Tax=Erythrobacter sp. TaxID=1042 RepID=UPI00260B2951|nr:flagellar biosynthesis protein FlgL [Erythrobacter sp.]MDJ0979149.1 flagellar biosynthesis protein FlgL [Erythrobacter sp.]
MTFVSNSTGAFYDRSLAQMSDLRVSLEELQTQISTGRRIERGSDDPAAASRLRTLARTERLAEVQADNADKLARDLTAAGDEVLGVANLLSRARELAILAANDPTGANGREAIAQELEQLEEELFDRANAQTLTGEPLFAGTAAGPAFVRGPGGAVSYNGNGDIASVNVAPGTDLERGLAGSQIFQFDVNGTPSDAFAVLADLTAALQPGVPDPAAAARAAIEGLDAGIEAATRSQTVLGTRLAWVEVVQDAQVDRGLSIDEQQSDLGDTDLGEAIARLQQTETALEASQLSFTRVSNLSLFNAL